MQTSKTSSTETTEEAMASYPCYDKVKADLEYLLKEYINASTIFTKLSSSTLISEIDPCAECPTDCNEMDKNKYEEMRKRYKTLSELHRYEINQIQKGLRKAQEGMSDAMRSLQNR